MRHTTLILPTLLLSSQVLLANPTAYIGLGLNAGSGTQTRSYSAGSEFETLYTSGAASIKFGTIDSSNNRSEFVLTSIVASADTGTFAQNTTGDTSTSNYTGIDYNGIWTLGQNKSFAPFFSFGFGVYANDSIDGINPTTGAVESAGGFSFNSSLGLYIAYGVLEIEAAINSKAIVWNIDDPQMKDSITSAYVGVNFKF